MLIGSCSVECATMPATILNTELACDQRQVGIPNSFKVALSCVPSPAVVAAVIIVW